LDTARQAGRILEAWNSVDGCRLRAELESTLALCEMETPVSELENEQQAVLQSIVQRFRLASQENQSHNVPPQLEAGLFLLRHLRSRAA
jgi:hypothetical protein